MLFYLKKHIVLELSVTLILGGIGWLGIRYFEISVDLSPSISVLFWAAVGAAALAVWTLLVQSGYALVCGREYAVGLTKSLASQFEQASMVQVIGALFAAAGEEVFFRGFIQGQWGLLAGSVAFMLAHIGKRDIRVIGYWSIFQGLALGIIYLLSGNLLVPMLSHGLFDMGAMAYFRVFMAKRSS